MEVGKKGRNKKKNKHFTDNLSGNDGKMFSFECQKKKEYIFQNIVLKNQ